MAPTRIEDTDFENLLESAKRNSVAQLLFKSARLWNQWALERLQAEMPEAETVSAARLQFREAHTRLLPFIDLQGTRITELAARLGHSKQAVSQLVKEMQTLGIVEVLPDPEDGRARRVCFSERGKAALLHGLGVLKQLEAELAQELGADQMAQLLSLLQRLLGVLELQQPPRS